MQYYKIERIKQEVTKAMFDKIRLAEIVKQYKKTLFLKTGGMMRSLSGRQ